MSAIATSLEPSLLDLRHVEDVRRLVAELPCAPCCCDPHSIAVAECAAAIAEALTVDQTTRDNAVAGALVHDAGKAAIDESILNKPGPLTDAERAVVNRHPEEGAALLAGRIAPGVLDVVLSHHERWDGRGYPHGRAGADIPVAARIVATADAFLAMLEERPYRIRRSVKAAVAELEACAGSQFDPDCVTALLTFVP
jgi:HD-GYP domain-containing protein (c-di-GMP phosphodiesterase class II)